MNAEMIPMGMVSMKYIIWNSGSHARRACGTRIVTTESKNDAHASLVCRSHCVRVCIVITCFLLDFLLWKICAGDYRNGGLVS